MSERVSDTLWSPETKIDLHGNNSACHIWRMKVCGLCVWFKVKHGGGSLLPLCNSLARQTLKHATRLLPSCLSSTITKETLAQRTLMDSQKTSPPLHISDLLQIPLTLQERGCLRPWGRLPVQQRAVFRASEQVVWVCRVKMHFPH